MTTKVYTLSRFSLIDVPAMRKVLRRYQERGSLTFSEEKRGGKVIFSVTADDVFHQATVNFFDSTKTSYEVEVR